MKRSIITDDCVHSAPAARLQQMQRYNNVFDWLIARLQHSAVTV